MKIDIAIGFNDVKPPPGIGMVMHRKPPYYDQLLALIKSIKLNWNKNVYDYSIYVHYSRDLAEQKKQELESLGCTTVFNPSETQPYFNRENILNHETNGDYTLILDTDMLVLGTPSLDFNHEIYARPAGSQCLAIKTWLSVYKKFGLKYEKKTILHFNGGCFLIKNGCKKLMYGYYMANLEILKLLEGYNRQQSVQHYYSLLLKKLDWALLDKRINVFSRKKIPAGTQILHYLGIFGYNSRVESLIEKITAEYPS